VPSIRTVRDPAIFRPPLHQSLTLFRKWKRRNVVGLLIGLALVFAAVEAGLIILLAPHPPRMGPIVTVGVISCVLDLSGFVPLLLELLKRRGRAADVDFVFLAIDCSGFFFSLLALATQRHFDLLFGITAALW